MEQGNMFDKVLQDKFAGFAPEPSDKVWENVRKQIGPKPQGPWANILGVAMVGITAGFFLLNFSTTPTLPAANSVVTPPIAIAQPAPQLPTEKPAAENQAEKVEESLPTLAANESPVAGSRTPVRASNSSPTKMNAGSQSKPVSPTSEKVTVLQPQPNGNATAQPKQEMPTFTPVENAQDLEPAVQQGENFVTDGKQTQRGKLLHKVAEMAEKNLGIESEFSEKQYEDYTKTSFSADLKFLKIKRVKTRKND